jgi:hypothetical protein
LVVPVAGVVVEAVLVVVDGLVDELLQPNANAAPAAAPITPIASRRLNRFLLTVTPLCLAFLSLETKSVGKL